MDWNFIGITIGLIVVCKIMLIRGKEPLGNAGDLLIVFKIFFYLGIIVLLITLLVELFSFLTS